MEEFNLEREIDSDGESMERKGDFRESNEGTNLKDELLELRKQVLEQKEHESGNMEYETHVGNGEDFDITKWFLKAIEGTESKEELKGLKKWVLENFPEDDDPEVKELVLKIQGRKRK